MGDRRRIVVGTGGGDDAVVVRADDQGRQVAVGTGDHADQIVRLDTAACVSIREREGPSAVRHEAQLAETLLEVLARTRMAPAPDHPARGPGDRLDIDAERVGGHWRWTPHDASVPVSAIWRRSLGIPVR